jgi:flagellar motor protein MotB
MQRKCIAHAPLLLFAVVFGVGCGPSEKDKKIQDLMAENDQLKNELMDRDRRLNDATIRDNEARATIDELNRELAQVRAGGGKPTKDADGWITMPSFTDNDPIRRSKWKDNWELGAQRSLTVIRTLRELGLPSDSLVQANCGEHRPKSSNTSKDGKLQNRRVEFYAVKRSAGVIDANTAARAEDLEQ